MKKLFALISSCTLLVTLAACGSTNPTLSEESREPQTSGQSSPHSEESSTASSAPESTPDNISEPKTGTTELVVYFSWSGNTETIAGEIASPTGADIFNLEPTTAYSTDYNALLDEAQAEQRVDARPEISGSIENFDSYDVIYLGFPNWWGDMPMILYSFLDEYDLSGKTIAPFVSSGGSGFSGTLKAIADAEPGAAITDGLSLSSEASKNPGSAVTDWLADIRLAE
ncbi:NAD(P)H-dependent oxidoreductase [Lacrimispora sp. NSJ-141]|uniref:NAD(P)H-dependent oxidoreductase n=1 Tax=Lientehia hominis TaxID=2897778 RepID=A0AAP2RJS2_9FIRM|nr:flavodoxin [Lientehia hominis]MCD2492905.1 NAD(P)H-dependent oxidoreductase [Lientehia hominis]